MEIKKMPDELYEKELKKLQIELVKLQEWVHHDDLKVVVIFEGRDAAGKGGIIKRITERLNPRICKVVALGKPTEKEETQWYFQRYAPHLPAAGEIVLFDRSWYNAAGVDRVMDFVDEDTYQEFLRACPLFEEMLIRSGIKIIKYWFDIEPETQESRFQARIDDPTKRWKLSPMDLKSRDKWDAYSEAKDIMFKHTDTELSPWYVVDSNIKKNARINCITHLLSMFAYKNVVPPVFELTPRNEVIDYKSKTIEHSHIVRDTATEIIKYYERKKKNKKN